MKRGRSGEGSGNSQIGECGKAQWEQSTKIEVKIEVGIEFSKLYFRTTKWHFGSILGMVFWVAKWVTISQNAIIVKITI